MRRTDYKLFAPDVRHDAADWAKGITVNAMPLNAAIREPTDDGEVTAGPVTVRRHAAATGRTIERVDVSVDGGLRRCQATMERWPEAPRSWTFWEVAVNLPPGTHELVVRA